MHVLKQVIRGRRVIGGAYSDGLLYFENVFFLVCQALISETAQATTASCTNNKRWLVLLSKPVEFFPKCCPLGEGEGKMPLFWSVFRMVGTDNRLPCQNQMSEVKYKINSSKTDDFRIFWWQQHEKMSRGY